jgi:hypothetical protein
MEQKQNLIVEIWKTKYAKKRLEGILKKGTYKKESLFYDDLIGVDWEETKRKYLKQVGR